MNYWNCLDGYYIFKCIYGLNKIIEQKRREKKQSKLEKKRMINAYGYQYYLRDKTWNRVKNKKRRESFDLWRYRLALYGFTVDGYDTKYNAQHFAEPNVDAFTSPEEMTIDSNAEEYEMNNIWNKIVKDYKDDPRDVLTAGGRKYFYVYAEGNEVFIESGRTHSNASKISSRRRLDKESLDVVYNKYKTGARPKNLQDDTFNSVYWLGIFSDLGL